MSFLSYIGLQLILPSFVSLLTEKGFIKFLDKSKIENIKNRMSVFIKDFEDKEVDCGSFQDFFTETDIIERVYSYIFNSTSINILKKEEFLDLITREAIDFVNGKKRNIGYADIKNERIVFEYFTALFTTLQEIRNDCQSISEKAQTSILVSNLTEINSNVSEVNATVNRIVDILEKPNPLLKEKFELIRAHIDNRELDEAENEIENLLFTETVKTSGEREELYYLKGLILLNRSDKKSLESLISRIRALKENSIYIFELEFRIACNSKDEDLFNNTIKSLMDIGVETKDIIQKTAYFEIVKGSFVNVFSLLEENGVIKSEFSNEDKANFYLGIAYLQSNKFEKGKEYFNNAFNIKQKPLYSYNRTVAEILPILTKRELLVNPTSEVVELFLKAINEFDKLKSYFERLPLPDKIQFWSYYLHILLVIDSEPVEAIYNGLAEEIKSSEVIKGIMAEAYYLTRKYDKALDLLEDVQNKDIAHLIKYLDVLRIMGDWEKINKVLSNIKAEEYDEEGIIAVVDIESALASNNIQVAVEKAIKYYEKYCHSFYFIDSILRNINKFDNNDLKSLLLSRAQDLEEKLNDYEKLLLSRTFTRLSEYEYAKKLLECIYETNEEALLLYSEIVIYENNCDSLKALYLLIEKKCKEGMCSKELLECKAKIELKQENWSYALITLNELFDFENDYFSAFNALLCKFKLNEFSDSKKYIDFLLSTDKLSAHIMVARCYAEMERWENAQETAFCALLRNGEILKEEDLFNYVALYFNNFHCNNKGEVEYDTVTVDTTITLKDTNGKYRVVSIHSHNETINEDGEYKFGCENYKYDSDISLSLISCMKGDKIDIAEIEYEITDIIDIKAYYFRYCLNKLDSEHPNHGLYKKISAESAEELAKEMSTMLARQKESHEKLWQLYNFGVETGLPITYLSYPDLSNYMDVILSILYMENQRYYSGVVELIEDKPIIFSLSSLLLINYYNLTLRLEEIKENCFVTRNILNYVRNMLINSQTKERAVFGTSNIDEEGKLWFREISDVEKNNKIKFWKTLYNCIRKFGIIDVQVSDNEFFKLTKDFAHSIDIECIEGAKKMNGILVSDDLFIRKLGRSVYSDLSTTNFLGVAECILDSDFDEKVDLIHKLAKHDYLYCLNEVTLFEIVTEFIQRNEANQNATMKEKFEEIISNTFCKDPENYYKHIYIKFIELMKKEEGMAVPLYNLFQKPLNLKDFETYAKEQFKLY